MSKFAKLFELENGEQVLLCSDYNNDSDKYEISIQTDFEEARANVKITTKTEEGVISILDGYTQDAAVKFREEMKVYFK